ncbi:MAG: TerC family protein [Candidatus Delongbacteria bacterium]
MVGIYTGFIVFVVLMLVLDLGVFHRKAHVVSIKEALGWSAFWISLALSFTVFIYFAYENHWQGLGLIADPVDGLLNTGSLASLKYLTGYLIEESLSMDNLFVIAMILGFFAVPPVQQHRVLFWGILGALVLRGLMIALGATLVAQFHWVLYLFGAFLVFTGIKMLVAKEEETDLEGNLLVRTTRRLFAVTTRFYSHHFVVRAGWPEAAEPDGGGVDPVVSVAAKGALVLTPLALALLVVETADVVFAVDSIPAIFAITADPFLVFTSNIFAILGLRSLFFALAGMLRTFRYLKTSLSLVLILVGVKMLLAHWLRLLLGSHFNLYLLGAVLLILAGGVVASLLARENPEPTARA